MTHQLVSLCVRDCIVDLVGKISAHPVERDFSAESSSERRKGKVSIGRRVLQTGAASLPAHPTDRPFEHLRFPRDLPDRLTIVLSNPKEGIEGKIIGKCFIIKRQCEKQKNRTKIQLLRILNFREYDAKSKRPSVLVVGELEGMVLTLSWDHLGASL